MVGIFWILLFWLVGNGLSLATGGYISGNIIGMILLFAALCLRWVKAETVRPAAKFLLGAMALFFVPYGVGLMDSYRVILDNLWAIVVSGILSTIVVLLVSGHTFQRLNRRNRSNLIVSCPGEEEPRGKTAVLPEATATQATCPAVDNDRAPITETSEKL